MEQLRIIDKRGKDEITGQVEIQLNINGQVFSSMVDYFPSPIDHTFRKQLIWYFNDFLIQPYGKQRKSAKILTNNINQFGRLMGQRLFQGTASAKIITDKIEEIGAQHITVAVESVHPDFFEEPWEIIYLPNMSQCLSTSCAGFIRTNPLFQKTEAPLGFSKDNPVRVLMADPRPTNADDSRYQSKSNDIFNHLIGYEQSFEVEFLRPASIDNLRARLRDHDKPVHILHFDGPAAVDISEGTNSLPTLVFEDVEGYGNPVQVDYFAQLLLHHGVQIVLLDCSIESDTASSGNGKALPADIAINLIQHGVKNVITTAHLTYTFSTIQLFQILYSQIAKGGALSKAIVEARKFMKNNPEQNSLTAQKQEFHDWLLPVHFSGQDCSLFSENQVGVPFTQTKKFENIMNKLVGFNWEYLPPIEFFGRSQELHAVERLLSGNEMVIILGEAGIGKTRFVHHCAYWAISNRLFEKAFYFDFESNPANSEYILRTIGQEPNNESVDFDTIFNAVLEQKILLIFDGLNTCGLRDELYGFLEKIEQAKAGALVCQRKQDVPDVLSKKPRLALKGLSPQERRQFGVRVLQKNHLEEEEGDPEYLKMLDTACGHPVITESLLYRLQKSPADEILIELNGKLEKLNKETSITGDIQFALFELGWNKLSVDFRKILSALSDLSGFISDALPIAFDMQLNDTQSPGAEFFNIIDVTRPHTMSEFFKSAVDNGFYVKKQFGYEIRGLTLDYITKKNKEYHGSVKKREKLDYVLAKLYCLELRVLSPFMSENPNPILFQLIAGNKHKWFSSLETLWQKEEYLFYINSKHLFASIMGKIGLKNEYEAWCYDLASKIDFSVLKPETSSEKLVAWFNTACDGLAHGNAINSDVVKTWVDYWESWIKSPDITKEKIFHNTMMFLETFYRLKNDWASRKQISLAGLNYYNSREDYERVIASMKSLARCEEALGNLDNCNEYEQRLLNSIPYEKMEEGMRQKTTLDIISYKINRKAYDDAQDLINEFNSLPVLGDLPRIGEMFQADIYTKLDKLDAAVAIYSKLWAGVMKREHMVTPQKILKALTDLKSRMDTDHFDSIFQENAPGVDLPADTTKNVTG